jgi:hypothetical protein
MRAETGVACPVCLGANGVQCVEYGTPRDSSGFECQACGGFEISRSAIVTYFDARRSSLTALQRAALSHRLSTAQRAGGGLMITTDWVERFTRNARLPSPPEQATNLIRLIGDQLAETGEGYFLDDATDTARIGAFNMTMFNQLRNELETKNVIQSLGRMEVPNPRGVGVLVGQAYGLTLDGWERYEAERLGRVAGRYGFTAMKFGDAVLDAFIEATVKPAVRDGISYDLVDLRDVSRAGVIDISCASRSGTLRSSSSTSPTTTPGHTGRPATRRAWVSRWCTFASARSSTWPKPTSIRTTAPRCFGPRTDRTPSALSSSQRCVGRSISSLRPQVSGAHCEGTYRSRGDARR